MKALRILSLLLALLTVVTMVAACQPVGNSGETDTESQTTTNTDSTETDTEGGLKFNFCTYKRVK